MRSFRETLSEALEPHGVDTFGVCAYDDVLPLIPCRASERLPSAPRMVITCLFPYYTGEYPKRNMARYAIVNDYHKIAGKILHEASEALKNAFPDEEFSAFADISPIREKEAARLCGLGDIGENGLLISRFYGSYVFIGCIVTSMYIDCSDFLQQPKDGSGGKCRDCGKCVEACPAGILSEPAETRDMGLCLSHVTQKKNMLTEQEERLIQKGGFAWGCDRCQDVCPENRNPRLTPIKAFYEDITPMLTSENIDEIHRLKPCNYRDKGVLIRNLEIVERNRGGGSEWMV